MKQGPGARRLARALTVTAVLLAGCVAWFALSSADVHRVRALAVTELRLAALGLHTLDAAAASGAEVAPEELAAYEELLDNRLWVIGEVLGPEESAATHVSMAELVEEVHVSLGLTGGHAGHVELRRFGDAYGPHGTDTHGPPPAEQHDDGAGTHDTHGAHDTGVHGSDAHETPSGDEHHPTAKVADDTSGAVDPGVHGFGHGHGDFALFDLRLRNASTEALAQADQSRSNARALSIIAGILALIAMLFYVRTRFDDKYQADMSSIRQRNANRVRALVANSLDLVFLIDTERNVTYTTPNVSELYGDNTPKTLEGMLDPLPESWREAVVERADLLHENAVFGPLPATNHRGESRVYEIRILRLVDDPDVEGTIVTARDITDQTRLQERLEQRALIDDLTQIANRRAVVPRLADALADCEPASHSVALLMLDLDGFKGTNDTLGHAVGDSLLTAVANRLETEVTDGSLLARLGGDEFALVLDNVADSDEAMAAAERLRRCFAEPFKVAGWSLAARCSIGVAVTDAAIEPALLLARADLAMYEAKRAGRNRSALFDPSMEHALRASDRIYQALVDSDYDDEFSLVYQPIVDIDGGKTTSVEALLRWNHPELGFVSPADFIPIAERSGEIIQLGKWVLRQACHQAREWDAAGGGPGMAISVNVSAIQLAEPDFVATATGITSELGIDPGRIVIEVTETALAEQTDIMIAPLSELRTLGFRIAMDDFGTGYSSLGQLRDLPVDILKIDRSLVSPLSEHDSESKAIINAIVGLAEALSLVIVAEGVEDQEQLDALESSGVQRAQGYLLGRPCPSSDAEQSFGHPWQSAPSL